MKNRKLLLLPIILSFITLAIINLVYSAATFAASASSQARRIQQLKLKQNTRRSNIPIVKRFIPRSDKCNNIAPDVSIARPHIVVASSSYTIVVKLSCRPASNTLVQLISANTAVLPVPQPGGNMTIAAEMKEASVSLTAGSSERGMSIKLRAVLPDYPGKTTEKNIRIERN